MYILTKDVTIEAAHCLETHPGKCKNVHGHSWVISVTLFSETLNKDKMVADFGEIKAVVEKYDHQMINEISPFNIQGNYPTSENLAKAIADDCLDKFGKVERVEVMVKETENSTVTYVTNR